MQNTPILRWAIKSKLCVYCGERANSEEHFPPKSFCEIGFLLSACQECNSFAGTDWPNDFAKRAEFVHKRIIKKYRKVFETAEWTDSELATLSYSLREFIKQWQKEKQRLNRRVAWNAIDYIRSIDRNNVFVQKFAGVDFLEDKLGLNSQDSMSWNNLQDQRRQESKELEKELMNAYLKTGSSEALMKWGELFGDKYPI